MQRERSWYDPLHEFLEIATERWQQPGVGVALLEERVWKVHGPDSSGSYGDHNGIGGLEAFLDEKTGLWTAVVEDVYGHVIGQVGQKLPSGGGGLLAGDPLRQAHKS